MDGFRGEQFMNSTDVRNDKEQHSMPVGSAIHYIHYHGPVNNIGRAENTNFGNNAGIISRGSDLPHSVAGNQVYIPIDKADLIQLLRPILDASHTRDLATSPPNSACFPGTRTHVIRAIVSWANSSLLWNTHILWLYGYVGCGKSAIALSIALTLEQSNRLVGSFFFFRNSGDRSKMTRFATTLACQLAAAIPEAAPFIEQAIRAEPGLLQSSLVAQLRRLVYEPFKAAAWSGRLLKTSLLKGPFLIVIDGLDECEDQRSVEAFLDDMLDFFEKNPRVPLRFFITSRVEQHIHGRLKNSQVRLENLVNHCSRVDIDTFMHTRFEVEKQRNLVIQAYIQEHGEWPTKADKEQLVNHINGSFIFASALSNYILDPTNCQSTPMDRLPHALNMDPGLDTFYAQTLARSQNLPHFYDIISTIALLFEPLPIIGIAELLGVGAFEVVRVLVNLHAIIHVPGTDNSPVTVCHTSVRDFLTTKSRAGCFFAPPSYHLHLLYRCSILQGLRTRTAAATYSTLHGRDHLEQVTRSSAQEALRTVFPQTLDAFYLHALGKCENLPHFFDILSTIVLLFEPLPVAGIAGLIGIESSEVAQVLANLQAILHIPGTSSLPVTICDKSLYEFLKNQERSGPFCVSPSYHLKLCCRCFTISLERNKSIPYAIDYAKKWSRSHWIGYLNAVPERYVLVELEKLAQLSSHTLPYRNFFVSFLLFFWIFRDSEHRPQQVLLILTKCIEFLALALECDPMPDRWFHRPFYGSGPGFDGPMMIKHVYSLRIGQQEAMALQQTIQRVETAIKAKHSSSLLDLPEAWFPYQIEVDEHFRAGYWWYDASAPMSMDSVYKLFKWIYTHIKVEMNLVEPGVAGDFDLNIVQVKSGISSLRMSAKTFA